MAWPGAGRRAPGRTNSARARASRPHLRRLSALAACIVLLVVGSPALAFASNAEAAPNISVAAAASCAALAGQDLSATNGSAWGRTSLPGHGAADGWFGVDVCDNGLNAATPNSSNVSCDRTPTNWAATGCAPGNATSDGYGLSFQCVELVIRFSAWAFNDLPSAWGRSGWGNAPDLWLPANHPSDFVMYPNGSAHPPVPGDILVWGALDAAGQPWPAGPDGEHGGHIAVVAAVRDGQVITAEQNVKWGSQDHPSDSLALTRVGTQWILSGSTAPVRTMPTYRWQPTMGQTRATFGWLHSVRNTGVFPSRGTHSIGNGGGRPPSTPTPTPTVGSATATPSLAAKSTQTPPTQASGGLPSLASGVIVTGGVLADLTWSTAPPFTSATAPSPPRAQLRSLGHPPAVALAVNQRAASVILGDGERWSYALGDDGHLYAAHIAPDVLGIDWTNVGAPAGISLRGSVTASAFDGGIAVAVAGSDGSLWWRAGPAGALGDWSKLDQPAHVSVAHAFALMGTPGLGTPAIIAVGDDGWLYERVWEPPLYDVDGAIAVPADWSAWMRLHVLPGGIQLTPYLLVTPESLPTASGAAGAAGWADAPVDVVTLDTHGTLWRLRSTSPASGWTLLPAQTSVPVSVSSLLAAVVVPSTTSSAHPNLLLHVYVSTAHSLNLVSFPIGSSSPHGAVWSQLPALPAAASAPQWGSAVGVAPDASIYLLPSAAGAAIGGSADGVAIAADADQPLKSMTPGTGKWNPLGDLATDAPFSDTLTSAAVDSRWRNMNQDAHVSATPQGLQLIAGASGTAALVQGAVAGGSALSVHVTLPSGAAPSLHAGLALYLDDGNWMSLVADPTGNVALCVVAGPQPARCVSRTVRVDTSKPALWLAVMRSQDVFTGMASPDGQTWQTVGSWTAGDTLSAAPAQMPPSASLGSDGATPASGRATSAPHPSPTSGVNGGSTAPASRLAPLAFSQWGVCVAASQPAASRVATFTDFAEQPIP